MLTTQTLRAINDMQVNAQHRLPVTPNNGNPAGAYNMPHAQEQAQQPADPYAWLQPSPFMNSLVEDLRLRGERLRQEIAISNTEPVVEQPIQQQPVQPVSPMEMLAQPQPAMPPQQGLPYIPVRRV